MAPFKADEIHGTLSGGPKSQKSPFHSHGPRGGGKQVGLGPRFRSVKHRGAVYSKREFSWLGIPSPYFPGFLNVGGEKTVVPRV